jgi:transposase InsO family protein
MFIDDISRFTWLYPIANKSNVFNSFVQFRLLVEKQFSSPIKCLQTDNGREYISSLLTRYLMENGILHRRTCPHTSQQNGIVERKHRHIVDMGLTLLAQSGLNKKF